MAGIKGAAVEHNKFCVSVHFRNCAPGAHDAVLGAVETTLRAHADLHATRGRKVFEIRPQVRACPPVLFWPPAHRSIIRHLCAWVLESVMRAVPTSTRRPPLSSKAPSALSMSRLAMRLERAITVAMPATMPPGANHGEVAALQCLSFPPTNHLRALQWTSLAATRGRARMHDRGGCRAWGTQVDWDKGSAVLHLLSALGLGGMGDCLPIYIGDDRTDEDAFRALARAPHPGIGILVSSKVPWFPRPHRLHASWGALWAVPLRWSTMEVPYLQVRAAPGHWTGTVASTKCCLTSACLLLLWLVPALSLEVRG